MSQPWRERDDAMGALIRAAKAGQEADRPHARQRVWQRLSEQPPRRLGLWVPVAVALMALVAWWWRPAPQTPVAANLPSAFAVLALASGDVQSSDGKTWSAARVGQQLNEGTELKVAQKSRAYARFSGGGALFHEGTRGRLSARELTLERGTLVAAAPGPLTVSGGAYQVGVQAAVFQFQVAADEVTVAVTEGEARVRGPSTDVRVRAGESWSSRRGAGRAEVSAADVAVARLLVTSKMEQGLLKVAKPTGAWVLVDGVELGSAPLEVMLNSGEHQVTGRRGSLASHLRVTVGGAPAVVELPESDPLPLPEVSFEPDDVPPTAEQAAPRVSAPPDPAQRFMLARSLSRKGRYREALQLYEQLASSGSGWAEPSLYEVARLNLRALKQFPAASQALEQYRARFPKGALSHEVALSAIEVQLKLRAPHRALAEMDAFLEAFPNSERKGDVRFVRATVRRDRGDCSGAVADYLALASDPTHADDALYFAAVCEQQLGDEAAARSHLSEYLKRFPNGAHQTEVRRFFEGASGSGNSSPP